MSNIMTNLAIGIDLGTTYCCVAVWDNNLIANDKQGGVRILKNKLQETTTPSWVSFTESGDRLIGRIAKEQAGYNPKGTIFDVKRLMGKRFDDPDVQNDIVHFPYEVVCDAKGFPLIKIPNGKINSGAQEHAGPYSSNPETITVKPEEISAMLLSEMRSIAEAEL